MRREIQGESRASTGSPPPSPRSWWTAGGWIAAVVATTILVAVWAGFRTGLVRWIYRDGDVIWDSKDRLNIRSVLWSSPREIPPAIEITAGDETGGATSETSVVVSLRSDAGDYDLFERTLTRDGWTEPALLGGDSAPIHTEHDEVTPVLTRDGSVLFFASDRPRGLGGFDLYASRRAETGWSEPIHLGSRVNSPFDDYGPAPHPNGRLLVFATNRPETFILSPPEEWDDVPIANWTAADDNLAVVYAPAGGRLRGGWSDPEPISASARESDETTPSFSPSGTFLYFASNRAGGKGGLDIYRSRSRVSGGDERSATRIRCGEPESIGPTVNSSLDDSHPVLFLEGFALAYRVTNVDTGASAYFESRSHEVAPELSLNAVPLEVATEYAVWIGGFVIGGVALLGAVWAVLRYRHFWALSLSLRCALAAVFLHVGMLYGFYFWRISTEFEPLAPKAALAEVTIEKTLQARLTLATQRFDLDLPEELDPSAAPELSTPTSTQRVLPTTPLVSSVDAHVVETPALERVATVAATAAALPNLPEVTVSAPRTELVEDLARHERVAVESLPSPVPVEPASEPQLAPAGVAKSLQVESETPRPGAVGAVVAHESSQAIVHARTVTRAARTQVRAEVPEPPETLPPLARVAPAQPLFRDELPLPARVTEPEPELSVEPSAPSRRVEARAIARPLPAPAPAPPPPSAATLAVRSEWVRAPTGVAPTDVPDAAAELRESSLDVASRLPTAKADPDRLPEPSPVELARASAARSEIVPRPTRAERRLDSSPSTSSRASGSPASTPAPASAPEVAPANALNAVTAASPAPLASAPTPGSLTTVDASPTPAPFETDVRLPDGEAGRRVAAGAPEVGDVLGLEVPRARLAQSSHRSPTPHVAASPAQGSEPAGSSSAPSSLVAEAVVRPAPPAATEVARVDLPKTSSPSVAVVLPESDPNEKTDLRSVRSEPSRKKLVRSMGGTPESENAVRLGLEWLARNQSPDGRWDVDGFLATCPDCGSPGFHTRCDVAITGLALLCFLGQNHTHANTSSPYRYHVKRAIDWLLDMQTKDGLIAGRDQKYVLYNHGIATLALSEAYILTRDKRLRVPLRNAGTIIVRAQNRTTGGWRYLPQPPVRGDTSVTGWQVMALTSLKNAGYRVPEASFERARHWLDVEVAGGTHQGIYGYSNPEEPRIAMVAEGMFVRQLLGSSRTDRNIEEAARYIHSENTRNPQLNNLYFVYYSTLGLYQYQGWIWERWNEQAREYLVRTQHSEGPKAGSWDPTDSWTEGGGRLLSTCFAILSLEVYYRYLPLFWDPELDSGKGG